METFTKDQKAKMAEAKAEGLVYFWAAMHVGDAGEFLGHSWEDGGFSVDSEGNPTRDSRGNTVGKFSVEQLDETNAAHVCQVEKWWG